MSDSRNLTTGPVWARYLALAGPMVFGIIAVLSVSLVDTYFVGKLGTNPLAALSFTFPVTLTVTSLSIGLGAGAASVVSRAIGSGNRREAKRLSTDSLALALLIVGVVSCLGYFTIRPLFSLLGAEGEVLDMIGRYMRIWYISMPFLVMPMVANALIRSAGDAFWPSTIMIAAAFVNIATTPVLIFGWGPIPAYDIEGAALGTLVARFATLLFSMLIIIYREKLVTFRPPPLEELLSSWRRVVAIGVPAAAGNMVNPIGIAIVTAFLAGYGSETVAAFGVATRVESFSAIPMLALSSAIGPIAGQNWGASRKDRVVEALRLSLWVCLAWAAFLGIAFWFFGEPIASVFASEAAVAEEAALYLRIVPISLWGYGIVITAAALYNSVGKSGTGFGYYFTRSILLYVPLSWLASSLFGSREVYIAIAVSNAVAGVLVAVYAFRWLSRNAPPESDGRQAED